MQPEAVLTPYTWGKDLCRKAGEGAGATTTARSGVKAYVAKCTETRTVQLKVQAKNGRGQGADGAIGGATPFWILVKL